MSPFLIGDGLIAIVSIPLILKIVPPNPLYGFRTPSTVASPALWYRVNAFAGWALLIGAVASALSLWGMHSGALPVAVPEVVAFVAPMLIALVASFIYLNAIKRGLG